MRSDQDALCFIQLSFENLIEWRLIKPGFLERFLYDIKSGNCLHTAQCYNELQQRGTLENSITLLGKRLLFLEAHSEKKFKGDLFLLSV